MPLILQGGAEFLVAEVRVERPRPFGDEVQFFSPEKENGVVAFTSTVHAEFPGFVEFFTLPNELGGGGELGCGFVNEFGLFRIGQRRKRAEPLQRRFHVGGDIRPLFNPTRQEPGNP